MMKTSLHQRNPATQTLTSPAPSTHWRGKAVQATPPQVPIILADQSEVASDQGPAGLSHVPCRGAEPGGVLLPVFVFYGVFVGFYQTDVSDEWTPLCLLVFIRLTSQTGGHLVLCFKATEGRGLYSLTGRRRGGACHLC